MTGKPTPPNVTRTLAIAADSRLQPRVEARSSWISHPAHRCTAGSTRATAGQFQHSGIARIAQQLLPRTIGVRRRAAMPN